MRSASHFMPCGNWVGSAFSVRLRKCRAGPKEASCQDSIDQTRRPYGLSHFAAVRASSSVSFSPAESKYVFQDIQPVAGLPSRSRGIGRYQGA
ncbi:MAG: hypothetical protein BWZ10_01907 [candidate division BRC1 bacterium ADurb.BinA364]|nr:MAG: hypothetical protein BWZ10_01907 [candidate division BRC1 bacterium ADurb.BinA364]